jgi:TP901 family phage tail tape measure protein
MARKIEVIIAGDANSLKRAFAESSAAAGTFGTAAEQAAAKQHAGGQVINKAAKFGALAVGGLAAASIKAAGDFEGTLNSFQAVSGATGKEMTQVGKVAKQLGNDIHIPGASAADAADSMTELAKGGLSVRDSMSAAKATLILAAAAQTSNAEAATVTARALNTFSLKGKDAARVTDVLAGAANASTLEISDVAAGFQQAGSSAAALGIPIEDLATQLGLMANKGIAGSDAGTSLKTMMTRLNPSTKAAGEEVAKLGIHVYDSHGKFIGIRGAISQYSAALGKLNPEQRQSAINTIFGSDAQRAANIVLNGGTDAYDKMHKAVTKSGSAQAMADAKMKGFKGSLEAFKSTLETLAISFGEVLLPAATSVMHTFAGLTNTIGAHKTATMLLVAVIGGLALAVLTVNTAMKAYRATMLAWAAVQGAMTTATGGFATAFWALNAAMTANPIGVVVVALALLAAGLVFAYKHSETFRNIVNGAFNAVKDVAILAFGLIKKAAEYGLLGPIGLVITHWSQAKDILGGIWNAVKSVAETVWNAIKDSVLGPIRFARDAIGAVADGIGHALSAAWGPIKSAANTAWDFVHDHILGPIRDARDKIGDIADAIGGAVGKAWRATKAVITDAADGIKDALVSPFRGAYDLIKGIIDKIRDAVHSVTSLPGKALHAIGIGGNAQGGAIGGMAGGGMVRRVGELGPENVLLPVGSRVIQASQSASGNGGVNFFGPVTIGSHGAARAMANQLAYRMAYG